MNTEEFVEKARQVHGDKYDYSKVVYEKSNVKVCIICPKHGAFWQRPYYHLRGQGCPHKECVRAKLEETNLRKYGVRRPLQSKVIMDKCIQTNLERYGVPNSLQADVVQQKRMETCRAKYGVVYSCLAPSVIALKERTNRERYGGVSPFCSSEVREKAKATLIDNYGTEFVSKVPEIRAKVVETNMEKYGVPYGVMCEEIKKKKKETFRQKYGVDEILTSNAVIQKRLHTVRDRYGVDNVMHIDTFVRKVSDSKCENHTFCSSKSEDILYGKLVELFGVDDVLRTYNLDNRYPFACDFYIKSRDMFIELNAHWTHGTHWFDSSLDVELLNEWKIKAVNSEYYKNGVHVWSEADVKKRNVAAKSNLNYVVFWDWKLRDFDLWVDAGCPDSRDWNYEYDWFFVNV